MTLGYSTVSLAALPSKGWRDESGVAVNVTLFIPGTGSAALLLVSSERHSRRFFF